MVWIVIVFSVQTLVFVYVKVGGSVHEGILNAEFNLKRLNNMVRNLSYKSFELLMFNLKSFDNNKQVVSYLAVCNIS